MPAPKSLELTPEELARVQRAKRNNEAVKITAEEAFTAEFGFYFGWQGVEAILNNKITLETANKMLTGAQRTHYGHVLDYAYATYYATAAARTPKKSRQIMQKGLRGFMKLAKVET